MSISKVALITTCRSKISDMHTFISGHMCAQYYNNRHDTNYQFDGWFFCANNSSHEETITYPYHIRKSEVRKWIILSKLEIKEF